MSRRLTEIFICTARPLAPMWVTFGPMARSTGSTRSKAARSPPTMTEALPCASVTGLPEMGASSMLKPLAANCAATARLTSGAIVLMST